MQDESQRIERRLRALGEIAVANRSARDPAADGIGVTVSLRLGGAAYIVSVERYRDDGGFGRKLSRDEQTFENLGAALAEVARHGFQPDQLKF